MDSRPRKRRSNWSPPATARSQKAPPSSGEELERSLLAAEQLLREALDERRHAQNRRTGAFSMLVAAVSVLGIVAVLVDSAGFGGAFGMAIALLGTVVLLATALRSRLFIPSRDAGSARLRVALQLAAMIDEVYAEMAQREGWSYFRTESTRLRLSAFPLGPHRAAAGVSSLPNQDQERGKP